MPDATCQPADRATEPRRWFWCQELCDLGDNPDFPEFTGPNDDGDWLSMAGVGQHFTYILHTNRLRNPVYVGYTGNIYRRLRQHRKLRAWWPLVDRITVTRHDDQAEALETESNFIRIMHPLLNVAQNRHSD